MHLFLKLSFRTRIEYVHFVLLSIRPCVLDNVVSSVRFFSFLDVFPVFFSIVFTVFLKFMFVVCIVLTSLLCS